MLKFPKGYKQYKVLELVSSDKGVSYTEIIKLAYELGSNRKFDTVLNRGYWSGIFKKVSKNSYPWQINDRDGWATVLMNKDTNGKYYLNSTGAIALENLKKRFSNLTPAEAIELQKLKSNSNQKEKMNSMLIDYANSLDTDDPLEKPISNHIDTPPQNTQVTLRGLELDDKVVYYRRFNNKTGYATVISTILYSSKTANYDRIQLGVDGGVIPDIEYNPKTNSFKEASGHEIEIIKIPQ
jgi:hypothetical protein